MEQYAIKGGNPLVGEVEIGGAKNAALGVLAAAIMTDEMTVIDNLPDVRDINVLLQAMESIGVIVYRIDRHTARINASMVSGLVIEDDYIKKSGLLIICLEPCLENINMQKLHFRAAVISEVARLTFISRASKRLERT